MSDDSEDQLRINFEIALQTIGRLEEKLRAAEGERDRLDALINSPHVDNFMDNVRTEAAHQRERWGVDHDAGKADADWFWLIGYVAGKAMRPTTGHKRLHHIITTAAVCLNWHAHAVGEHTEMRPGIEPPKGEVGP